MLSTAPCTASCNNVDCNPVALPADLHANPLADFQLQLLDGALHMELSNSFVTTEAAKAAHAAQGHTPQWASEEHVVDKQRWIDLCARYKDVFEAPGMPVDRSIKHRIDLLNPNAPIKYHRQYRMS